MKKIINAIVKIPIEIVNNEIHKSHSDLAQFSFEWIDEIPKKKMSQTELLKELHNFIVNPPHPIHSQETVKEDDNSSIEDMDDDSTIGHLEMDEPDEEKEKEKEKEKEEEKDEEEEGEKEPQDAYSPDNLMDIMNIFIKREELVHRKKPKNSSFKKRSKRKSCKSYTMKNYDDSTTEEDVEPVPLPMEQA